MNCSAQGSTFPLLVGEGEGVGPSGGDGGERGEHGAVSGWKAGSYSTKNRTSPSFMLRVGVNASLFLSC